MRAHLRAAAARLHGRWLSYRVSELGDGAVVDRRARLEYPGRLAIGDRARIEHGVVIRANTSHFDGVAIGADTAIKDYAVINANEGRVLVGERSWIGPHCLVYGNGGVVIGDDVLIAAHTTINTVSHLFDCVDRPINVQGIQVDPVVIEDDVWVGLNCTILQGVTIGRGSVIAAGAVVTRDIPPWSIAMGTPARVTRRRKFHVAAGRALAQEELS